MTDTSATSPPRSIEYVSLDEIRPADRNPKRHDHDTLRASFRRFGFVEPIVRDDRTGKLVAGHGRCDELRMARSRDADNPPPGVRLGIDRSWLVPVLVGWRSTNDDEAQAYVIASNRTVEGGGWDDSILADVLTEWDDPEMFAGIGYTLDDALAMLSKSLGQMDDDDADTRPQLEDRQFRVVINCDDETHQAELIERFTVEGLTVRAVIN